MEPESPHEGACLRNILNRNRGMRGAVFKKYLEPKSWIRGACLIRGGVFKIDIEPESPNEGACFTESPNEGACLR